MDFLITLWVQNFRKIIFGEEEFNVDNEEFKNKNNLVFNSMVKFKVTCEKFDNQISSILITWTQRKIVFTTLYLERMSFRKWGYVELNLKKYKQFNLLQRFKILKLLLLFYFFGSLALLFLFVLQFFLFWNVRLCSIYYIT